MSDEDKDLEKLGLQLGALVGYEMMHSCERLYRLFKMIPELGRSMGLADNLLEDLDDLVSAVPLADIKGAENKCRSALKKIDAEFKAQNMESSIIEIRERILRENQDDAINEILQMEEKLNAKSNPGQTSSKPVSKQSKKKSKHSKKKNSQNLRLKNATVPGQKKNTGDHQLKKARNKKRKVTFDEDNLKASANWRKLWLEEIALKNTSSNSIQETVKLEPQVITTEPGTKALNVTKLSGNQKQKKQAEENYLENSSLNGIIEISELEPFDIKLDDFMADPSTDNDPQIVQYKQVHIHKSNKQNASEISKDKINYDQEPESNRNSKRRYEGKNNKERETIGNTSGDKLTVRTMAASNNKITVSGYSAKRNICQDEDKVGNNEDGTLCTSLIPSVPMHPDIIRDEGPGEPIIEEILGNIGGCNISTEVQEQQENNKGDHKDTVGDNKHATIAFEVGPVASGDAAITFKDSPVANEDATIAFEDGPITNEDAAITFEDGPITNEDVAITFEDGSVVDVDATLTFEDGPVSDVDDVILLEDNPGAYIPGTYEDPALSTVELITID